MEIDTSSRSWNFSFLIYIYTSTTLFAPIVSHSYVHIHICICWLLLHNPQHDIVFAHSQNTLLHHVTMPLLLNLHIPTMEVLEDENKYNYK